MDLFRKLLPHKKSKDIASQSSENRQLTPVTPHNTNTNLGNEIINAENDKIEGHSGTSNQHFDKIYSNDGQVLFEGPYNISENAHLELIDFEELIDLTLEPEVTITTLEHMNEFENVFNSFNNKNININNEDDFLDLDEINDFLNADTSNTLEQNSKLTNTTDTIEINITENPFQIKPGSSHLVMKNSAQTQNANISNSHDSNIYKQESSNDIVDTISISSSSDDGYKSSDFEFITENDAKMDGFIINLCRNDSQSEKINEVLEDIDPGEGPSGINNGDYRQNHELPEGDAYLDLFQGPYNPVLPWSDIIVLENKSIRPSAMNAQYEGMGFDKQLRRCDPDSSEEEYADEANECIKKILFLYPGENKKRKRRRR